MDTARLRAEVVDQGLICIAAIMALRGGPVEGESLLPADPDAITASGPGMGIVELEQGE